MFVSSPFYYHYIVESVTPVSNSMVELYTMQRYLQYDTLREKGLLHFDAWASTLKLGLDSRGNLTRIDNALGNMQGRLQSVQKELENLYNQQAAAKVEVQKPFMQEQELKDKTARLATLDRELNMSAMRSAPSRDTGAVAKRERPSILDSLKQPPPKTTAPPKKSKVEREEW